MFTHAKWIWPDDSFTPNTRADFLFTAKLDTVPASAEAFIGCETKYWLFVNQKLVVFDGGLFRESRHVCGYFDTVDLAPFLRAGDNEIALHVWYFGNGGRNNVRIDKGGLIFSCPKLELFSNEHTLCRRNDAYYTPEDDKPSYLYGGDHTAYDARVRPFSLSPDHADMQAATVVGQYGDTPWGALFERPIPLFFFSDRIPCTAEKAGEQHTVTLPQAMQFSPFLRVTAKGGEKIVIHSDRYMVNGGPGDFNVYRGHRAEYICRAGVQEFEMLDWIFGEKIYFHIPDGVVVEELGYRESGYPSDVTTEFSCDNPAVNALFTKCVRTLQICMRENYMDCPDRERGQWIGDVSVQAPQVAYLLDKRGLMLLRKAICDFIYLRQGDHLTGNVPGENNYELPSQSLNAISEWGMIASYYAATKDRDILELAFEPAIAYLKLWDTDDEGVVVERTDGDPWYDHLYNCDKPLLNICWYYSALRFAKTMAKELGLSHHDEFIAARMQAIEKVFDKRYWHAAQRYFASGSHGDDRANAMAVLSGLCTPDKYPQVRYLLLSVFNSTTYMENYVLTALCEMGYKEDALRRMLCRYQPLIDNENSTLWEDFFHLGTRNHAWSGGPATILLRYFVGIQPDLTVKETDITPLKALRCSFVNNDGETVIIDK